MSAALLKRSLAIVENNDTKKKDKYNQSKKYKYIQKKNLHPYTLVNEKRTVNDIKKKIENNADRANENIEKLLKLSGGKGTNMDSKTFNKLIQRAQSKRYIVNDIESTKEQQSIFTEQDFKDFEKEYFATK